MTTLCLCDWVEPRVDRDRRLAALAIVAPRTAFDATSAHVAGIQQLPILLPVAIPGTPSGTSVDPAS